MSRSFWAPGPLVDWQLRQLGATLVEGFDASRVNQATYNFAVGERVVIEAGEIIADEGRFEDYERTFLSDGLVRLDISNATEEQPLYIAPRQWLLSEVSEYIHMPNDMDAKGHLRSSAARRGWNHATALYVDPGYEGCLTLELINQRHFHSLPIYPGIQLLQLQFNQLANTPNTSYAQTGRYCGDTTVTTCQDKTI